MVEISSPVAVFFNGKLFVGERRWRFHPHLYVFNIIQSTWSTLPFPENREWCRFALAVANSKLYIMGGDWTTKIKEEECSSEVWSLDSESKWSNSEPQLTFGRHNSGGIGFDTYILLAGGRDCRDELLSCVEIVDVSLSNSTWREITQLPIPSYYLQCTISEDYVFLGLGVNTSSFVYKANIAAIKSDVHDREAPILEPFWHKLPEVPLRCSGLTTFDNSVLVLGGWKDDRNLHHGSIFLYDDHHEQWSEISLLKQARHSCACCPVGTHQKKYLFVICGHGAARSVESHITEEL